MGRKEVEIIKEFEQRVNAVEKFLGIDTNETSNIHFLLTMTRNLYDQGAFLNSENAVLKEFLTEKGLMPEMEAWLDKKQAVEQAPVVPATQDAKPLGDLGKVE